MTVSFVFEVGFELIDVSSEAEDACRKIDARNLGFGLRSFCVVRSGDTALRLKIAEMRGFDLNS